MNVMRSAKIIRSNDNIIWVDLCLDPHECCALSGRRAFWGFDVPSFVENQGD